jgi:hypothetical protein
MKAIVIFLMIFSLAACKRHLSKEYVEEHLKASMKSFLYNKKDLDTTKTKFTVLSVSYFEDSTFYECEFKVNLKQPDSDTTGMMAARISKDFVVLNRKY